MKNIKPFGPTIGITKIKKNLIKKLNNEFDLKSTTKKKIIPRNLQVRFRMRFYSQKILLRSIYTKI